MIPLNYHCCYRGGGHKPTANVVHHHAETLQCSHAEHGHVACFREDHLIVGFAAFGAEDCVADLPLDLLPRGRGENPLPTRRGGAATKQGLAAKERKNRKE